MNVINSIARKASRLLALLAVNALLIGCSSVHCFWIEVQSSSTVRVQPFEAGEPIRSTRVGVWPIIAPGYAGGQLFLSGALSRESRHAFPPALSIQVDGGVEHQLDLVLDYKCKPFAYRHPGSGKLFLIDVERSEGAGVYILIDDGVAFYTTVGEGGKADLYVTGPILRLDLAELGR